MFTFTLACTQTGPAIGVKQEKTGPKETAGAVQKSSGAVKAAAAAEKEPKPAEKASAAEAKPVVDEITGKQKAAKPEKTSAAEEKIKKLIAEVEEEQKATAAAEEELMYEITGLIIEETMTKIGYDFYEYFFLLWEPPQTEMKNYNIVITERASPLWGSVVEINVAETTVWGRVLRPRSAEIEDASIEAVEALKQYLINYGKHQFKTPDMMGTGI